MAPSNSTSSLSKRVITTYDQDKQRQAVRTKRRTQRILGKIAVCICSVSCCATVVWLGLYMKKEIFNFSEISSNQLDHNQNIDEAEFGYFGPQNENLWRAILIANLLLTLLTSLYIPLGVLFEHYYPITLYGGLMFVESVLSIGNQYMSVSYYFASAIFFLTGFTVHVFVHYLRLDIVDELMEWKRIEREELLKQQHDENHQKHHSHSTTSTFGRERYA